MDVRVSMYQQMNVCGIRCESENCNLLLLNVPSCMNEYWRMAEWMYVVERKTCVFKIDTASEQQAK